MNTIAKRVLLALALMAAPAAYAYTSMQDGCPCGAECCCEDCHCTGDTCRCASSDCGDCCHGDRCQTR